MKPIKYKIIVHFICLITFIVPLELCAQGLINNGANVVISNTANMIISGSTGNYVSQGGGLIRNSTIGGRITLGGNWINNSTNTGFANTGSTVVLNNSAGQSIGGSNATNFYNLTLQGSGTKTFNASVTAPLQVLNNFDISSPVVYTNVSEIIIGKEFNGNQPINSGTLPVTVGDDWFNTATGYTIAGPVKYTGATGVSLHIGALNYTDLLIEASRGAGSAVTTILTGPVTVSRYLSVGSYSTFVTSNLLTLKATATSNANVSPLLNGASVSGNVVVESVITGGTAAHRGTRMIASPINDALVSGSKTIKQLQGSIIITGPGGAANGFDPGNARQPFATTLIRYNEAATQSQSQFTPVSAITDAVTPGTSLLLFYRGDRSNYTTATAFTSPKLNLPFSVPENTLMRYTGPINQGNVTVNLSYTNHPGEATYNGYNAVGNPYPSVIDWNLVQKTNLSDLLLMIKPQGGYATQKGGIQTNTDGMNMRYIQPGQGFYVQANAANASIVFRESAKVNGIANPARFMRTSPKPLLMSTTPLTRNNEAPWKQLRMQLKDSVNTEEAVLVFDKACDQLATEEDAAFMAGSSISLSSLSGDDKNLVINFMPDLSGLREVKLNITSKTSQNVTLGFTDMTATGSYRVFLKDSFLNKQIEVKENDEYPFQINIAETASYGSNRLKLVFERAEKPVAEVKPVDLSGEIVNNGAELNWEAGVTPEKGTVEVERSDDGKTFVTIGEVNTNNPPVTESLPDAPKMIEPVIRDPSTETQITTPAAPEPGVAQPIVDSSAQPVAPSPKDTTIIDRVDDEFTDTAPADGLNYYRLKRQVWRHQLQQSGHTKFC